MDQIENILQAFDPISLDEMDRVKLMNRIDTKFVFKVEQVSEILQEATDLYRILEIDGKRLFLYETLYLDTLDNQMYLDHHNGKLNRYKVRFRNYVDSNKIFLEIKYKTNKGRTIKKRIKRKEIDTLDSKKAKKYVEENSPYLYETLEPKMWSKFWRLTLVHKSVNERITVDLNLSYYYHSEEKDMSIISIAEVKQDISGETSDFIRILQSRRIYPTSFSKYCFGRNLLNRDLKQNRFKTRLLTLNKLHHDNRLIHLVG